MAMGVAISIIAWTVVTGLFVWVAMSTVAPSAHFANLS
jgi:hypothetical protein